MNAIVALRNARAVAEYAARNLREEATSFSAAIDDTELPSIIADAYKTSAQRKLVSAYMTNLRDLRHLTFIAADDAHALAGVPHPDELEKAPWKSGFWKAAAYLNRLPHADIGRYARNATLTLGAANNDLMELGDDRATLEILTKDVRRDMQLLVRQMKEGIVGPFPGASSRFENLRFTYVLDEYHMQLTNWHKTGIPEFAFSR